MFNAQNVLPYKGTIKPNLKPQFKNQFKKPMQQKI
jgi:hypothetical protein